MPVTCPHCSGELKEYLPKSRLDDETAKVNALKKELLESASKVAAHDDAVAKAAKLEKEIADVRDGAARETALVKAGVRPEGQRFAMLAWESAMEAEADESKRQPFADWIVSAGKEHPAVKGFIDTAPAGAKPPPGVKPPPNVDTGAKPPPGQPPGKITAQDVMAFTSSPEFQALPIADRKAKLAEFKSQAMKPPQQGA